MKNTHCKKTIVFFLVFFSAFILLFIIFEKFFVMNYDIAKNNFFKNENDYHIVAEYLSSLEDDTIFRPSLFNINLYNDIADKNVIKSMKNLTNAGCRYFLKQGDTIYFHLWSIGSNAGKGIAYTIDGSIPDIEYLIYYQNLSGEEWFYCEDDCNKWYSLNE